MSKYENRCNNRACRNQPPYSSTPLSDEDKDKLFKCSRCKTTKYCSKICQKEDWKVRVVLFFIVFSTYIKA